MVWFKKTSLFFHDGIGNCYDWFELSPWTTQYCLLLLNFIVLFLDFCTQAFIFKDMRKLSLVHLVRVCRQQMFTDLKVSNEVTKEFQHSSRWNSNTIVWFVLVFAVFFRRQKMNELSSIWFVFSFRPSFLPSIVVIP